MSDSSTEGDGHFRCIECGVPASLLVKKYNAGVIKMMHCTECEKLVDKYLEYDSVIIFLDALLHKAQAYRHLLFNSLPNVPWKLLLIYLLCDAYIKWDNLPATSSQGQQQQQPFFYAALEWDFYLMFLQACIEWWTFFGSLLVVMRLWLKWKRHLGESFRSTLLLKGAVVSSFGKLLAIPSIIWGQTHSANYLMLTKVFIFSSNIAAVKVLHDVPRLEATILVGIAYVAQICLTSCSEHMYWGT